MSNKPIVLVIEDDKPKQKSILSFLTSTLREDIVIISVESLSSAIAELSTKTVILAVVDMSIPQFDVAKDRLGGGKPQGFGGADVLRFIDSETDETYSIVLTQYEEFKLPQMDKKHDPRGLQEILKQELDERFLGVIHYTGQYGPWQTALAQVLRNLNLVASK
ncbi:MULTISPECIES: hypothetical protein [Acinetobacter]|uniref:hypothetical protein n=1 Tax=Acinetobacter TaxID=469 RepID=UPI0002CFE51A|nr:hypothetical protein [Acinetobacter baumannii]ENW42781.1 hypothetical protein F919_02911 [Acinetobacter baumannii NIPH 329]MCT9370193.1 hypothetical protein [Acinetobacter baumannii]MDC4451877.1 hypothetical protein [Acinetobacter baumannii]MDC4611496.1 hypothetical protein [Acinetobacter baumannii]MDN8269053.1 hypothetical protein [Acinetobacter baumannii]